MLGWLGAVSLSAAVAPLVSLEAVALVLLPLPLFLAARARQFDPSRLVADTFELVVQVNGKLRDRIEAPADASREEQEALARQSERVLAQLNGGEVVKTVVVPGKLVNFVVR